MCGQWVRDWLLGVAASCTASCIYRRCSESKKRVENRLQQSPNRNEESPLTGCWSLATAFRRQTYGRSVFKVVATGRAPGAPAVAWVPRTTYVTASQALTPQEAHGRRSSNGRKGAGQPVRPPGRDIAPAAGYPRRPRSEAPRPPGLPFELPDQAPPPAAQEGTSPVVLDRVGLEQRG